MTNKEKITEPWKWGWSAKVFCFNQWGGHVLQIEPRGVTLNTRVHIALDVLENHCKITGYLYAGELAGVSVIPTGQKFKLKSCDDIYVAEGGRFDKHTIRVLQPEIGTMLSVFDKSEIEPCFI